MNNLVLIRKGSNNLEIKEKEQYRKQRKAKDAEQEQKVFDCPYMLLIPHKSVDELYVTVKEIGQNLENCHKSMII